MKESENQELVSHIVAIQRSVREAMDYIESGRIYKGYCSLEEALDEVGVSTTEPPQILKDPPAFEWVSDQPTNSDDDDDTNEENK